MRYRVVLAIPATMSVIASFAAARDFSLNARKVPFISATKLLTRDANLTVVDSGNINVHATNRVAVKIVGNGTIGYAGKPSDVSQTIQVPGPSSRSETPQNSLANFSPNPIVRLPNN